MDQNKLQQIQFLEQNLQALIMQKQAFEMELNETAASLKEIEKSKDTIYKVVGQLMIATPKDEITEELKGKEKLIGARIKAMDKQQEELQKQAEKLQKELVN